MTTKIRLEAVDRELFIIDIYKVFMMMCVVFYHVGCLWQKGWSPVKLNSTPTFDVISTFIIGWLNTFHIYAFVFASGYIFAYLRYEKGKYRSPYNDIKKRLRQLIIPYIVLTLFWCAPIYVFEFGFDAQLILKKFILGVSPSQLWFLLMLFWVFLIFYFISDILLRANRKLVLMLLYIASVFAGLLLSWNGIFNCLQVANSIKYLLFFFLGMIWRIDKYCFKKKYIFWMLIIVNLIGYTLLVYSEVPIIITRIFIIFVNISGILGMLGMVNCLFKKVDKNNYILCMLKTYSMPIYLLHQQILYGLSHVIDGILLAPMVIWIGCFLLLLIICILIVKQLSKLSLAKIVLGIR